MKLKEQSFGIYKRSKLPQFGWWAPGDYCRCCFECNEHFLGDKRAGRCADCAYKLKEDIELMKISAYTTAFDVVDGKFDLQLSFENYSKFVDEIVVATINDNTDDTKAVLENFAKENPKIKIVVLDDFDVSDPEWDGKIKNFALRNCSHEICLQIDLDELISGSPEFFRKFAHTFSEMEEKAVMMTSVNLFGGWDRYSDFGQKWYLHKKEGCYRGIVGFAKDDKLSLGFDPNKSDTCELIDEEGNLVSSVNFIADSTMINLGYPAIIHYGHIDFEDRAKRNVDFWKGIWDSRHGKISDVLVSAKEIEDSKESKEVNFKLHI
jgi:hypothetical protein